MLTWQAGFGIPTGATRFEGDADGDGDVDGDDFLVWQDNFGSGLGSQGAAIPEPGSLVLVMLLLAIASATCARG